MPFLYDCNIFSSHWPAAVKFLGYFWLCLGEWLCVLCHLKPMKKKVDKVFRFADHRSSLASSGQAKRTLQSNIWPPDGRILHTVPSSLNWPCARIRAVFRCPPNVQRLNPASLRLSVLDPWGFRQQMKGHRLINRWVAVWLIAEKQVRDGRFLVSHPTS